MINKIVIHCSATPNGREHDAAEINRWHLDRGWDGIGYHYVIKVDGVIENGRPEYWTGSHARGHNTNSLGVCIIGMDDYNDLQWNALRSLIDDLLYKYPDAKVIGHNEISKKTCPGFDVQKWLISIHV